ncbi:L-ascorbate metabolism protein UlaG, beta-lactamase superfamily [Peptoclostridium litorale DSM 5388]|uniref:Metal dependent hydrolase n=1 Tax=Peptoclostridium litorale DSM 5388 TaxID=1121324 RepID=A0A069RI58_PEPLI|nr:MBL fold metallo-hydrolase [Peptoclostridium litorale]KDR95835.1 hypothetical protein CLIT_8c00040 [Peptoclostridium litorale DSM 5388]SIO11666.1 L-ascorbate metabolism protein UlaG, beta-lactamase superfamily [Peptoclostridium litorale DSM 5388]
MYKAKIHYLYHSGFIVETDSNIFIFDYFNDECGGERTLDNGVIPGEVLKTGKGVYVFASHSHLDHFNPLIFDWKNINPKIEYILSSDIEMEEDYPRCNVISEGESIQIKDVTVKAYGSTDIGVSFLVNADGLSIFHAGDFNWWHWNGESDRFNCRMERSFKFKIEKLKGECIDIAFFPVDYRLEDKYSIGGEYFIENLIPKLFVPMHFGDHPEITRDFYKKVKGCKTQIAVINERGQEILYWA